MNGYASHYMCSSECPCNSEAAAPWIALGESKLNEYERTLVQKSATGPNSDALKDANGNYRIITTSDPATKVFTTFEECNNAL